MLEHHVLRRMDDGGRCVMSKMEPAKGIARAGNEGRHDSHSLVCLEKICVFLGQGPILALELE